MTDVSHEFSMVPESEQPGLTAEMLAEHEGRNDGQGANHDDVDRTLNATRNSNSFDDGAAAEPFPETVMDEEFARAEQPAKGAIHEAEEESKDDIERAQDNPD